MLRRTKCSSGETYLVRSPIIMTVINVAGHVAWNSSPSRSLIHYNESALGFKGLPPPSQPTRQQTALHSAERVQAQVLGTKIIRDIVLIASVQ